MPVYDDRRLFEKIILEGAQAGLSWYTILKKRENYRAAFDGFDAEKMAHYNEADIERLLGNAGIIRNRRKIESAIHNARVFLDFTDKEGSFSDFIWSFTDGKQIVNNYAQMEDIPATTPLSDKLSQSLKRIGFRFIGSTTTYAFMQSVGLVNDHLVSCFRHRELTRYQT